MKALKKLCEYARYQRLGRDKAILCSEKKGNSYSHPLLKPGQVCIATEFYSTGHRNPEIDLNLEEIANCPHRKV